MTAAQAQGEMQWSKYCKGIPESGKFLRCTELHLVLLCLTGKALPSDELARLCNSLATSAMDTDAASDVARLLQDCRDSRQACVSSSYMCVLILHIKLAAQHQKPLLCVLPPGGRVQGTAGMLAAALCCSAADTTGACRACGALLQKMAMLRMTSDG